MPSDKYQINVRVAEKGEAWIKELMTEHRCSAGEVVKAALAIAAARPDDMKKRLSALGGF